MKAWAAEYQITKLSSSKPLAFYIYFYGPRTTWYYLNGSIKRKDVDNLVKVLMDTLSKIIGIDDSQFFEVHAFKCIGFQRTNVIITDETIDSEGVCSKRTS